MAYHLLFACDSADCKYDIVLTHAEEWSPNVVRGGAPVPFRGEGKIGGLANCLWCPACRETRLHPFVTLNPPAEHAVVAYVEAQKLGTDGREVGPCPVCSELLTWDLEGAACPHCTQGVLHLLGEWEYGN